eukprot:1676644-Prorocentrum_lima.AAC.1
MVQSSPLTHSASRDDPTMMLLPTKLAQPTHLPHKLLAQHEYPQIADHVVPLHWMRALSLLSLRLKVVVVGTSGENDMNPQ